MNQNQFVTHRIIDQMHNGIVVSTFEIPAAWRAQSRVNWNYQHLSFPVTVSALAYNPNGAEAVELFPVDSFYWLEPDYGYRQDGLGQTCLRPMSAEQTMMNWVLPKYRGSRQNLRVIGAIPMPDLPQKINLNQPNLRPEAIAVKIEFSENNQIIEEILYGVKIETQVPSYGAAGTIIQTNWGFGRLFSFRAPQGKLEENRDIFWHIILSGKANPQWEQMYQQILQQMQQQFNQYLQAGYDQINAAAEMSRQISAQNDAWLAGQAQKREADHIAFEQKRRQEADAWGRYTNNDAFSDYMMGRETYQDPNAPLGEVKIDGNHDYVWTNQREEYIPTNDANFDPNVGSNENWVLLKKKNIGDK